MQSFHEVIRKHYLSGSKVHSSLCIPALDMRSTGKSLLSLRLTSLPSSRISTIEGWLRAEMAHIEQSFWKQEL
jgi:hypothetical protein